MAEKRNKSQSDDNWLDEVSFSTSLLYQGYQRAGIMKGDAINF